MQSKKTMVITKKKLAQKKISKKTVSYNYTVNAEKVYRYVFS